MDPKTLFTAPPKKEEKFNILENTLTANLKMGAHVRGFWLYKYN